MVPSVRGRAPVTWGEAVIAAMKWLHHPVPVLSTGELWLMAVAGVLFAWGVIAVWKARRR